MNYSHVDDTLAFATMDITPSIMPKGWDVVEPSPGSLEACTAYWREHGKIGVDPYFHVDLSIFGNPDCHRAFNAWHDFCHVRGQCTFDIPGETRVHNMMQDHFTRWWATSRRPVTQAAFDRASAVLRYFNLGRLEYWLQYGEPPANPRQFLYGYLTASHKIAVPRRCSEVSFHYNEWTEYS